MSEIHAHEIVVEEVLCGPFQLEIQSVGEVRGDAIRVRRRGLALEPGELQGAKLFAVRGGRNMWLLE